MSDRLSPALRAAAAKLGPQGRTALYSQGGSARRAQTGADIIRHFTGQSAAEKLLRETFVGADQDLQDGTARLAAMFEAALAASNKAVAAGLHPTVLLRAVSGLFPQVNAAFASCTSAFDDPAPVLRAFDLPEDAAEGLREAIIHAGRDGHVEVSDHPEEGVAFAVSQGFIADMEPLLGGTLTDMDRVFVLVVNDVIQDLKPLLPVIEGFAKSDKSLVIAARGLEGDARKVLERNRVAGILRVCAFVPVDKGPRTAEVLTDLAIATGSVMISEETGHSLDRLTPDMLGAAIGLKRQGQRITFLDPKGDEEEIALRLKVIAAEVARNRYLSLDREHTQRRQSRLAGRWVELSVGPDAAAPGLTNEVRRALSSIRSAQAYGTIEGAGRGLVRVADLVDALDAHSQEERAARRIVSGALRAPAEKLRVNVGQDAGYADWDADVPKVSDPVDLSRSLLEIALSLALQMMTLEAAVLRN
ncbi:hypothetical protein KPG71_18115 [Roseovarius sp. PS-C2]|uniref:TCP-1/cpn60 chaperonin family protein n=1 Tax=Roseovarius sp. PS-C2 TaxID=2820814 RepID=UPI001C0DE542|nr:TCP-1/cpn60 chaperonin family protein [Roseovarius sp. PS-C2]MBU3261942.1 hypothetical protein [Roseovarius sp. PS-C2]